MDMPQAKHYLLKITLAQCINHQVGALNDQEISGNSQWSEVTIINSRFYSFLKRIVLKTRENMISFP